MTHPIRSLLLAACSGVVALFVVGGSSGALTAARAQSGAPAQKWVATWAASPHGPYPSGNASAQPDLQFAIEAPSSGFNDQTVRLMMRPDLWGTRMRVRFSNAFGTQPVTFDDVLVGLQGMGGAVAKGTNTRVTFSSSGRVTIAPGQSTFSDPIDVPFVRTPSDPLLQGRRLAVTFHVVGATGPMTWHAKALTTSYVSAPRTGSIGADESDARLPYSTTSWYFVDAIDVMAPAATNVIVCFGDSITDGTASTLNGDDRWPDVLSRRLHAASAGSVSVVNAGIGGNQITGPAAYSTAQPVAGGPSAIDRVERDVLGLSGVTSMVWLEGINDLARGATADEVIAGMRAVVTRVRAKSAIRIIGATITSSLGTSGPGGTAEADGRRKAVNTFIRTGGVFDAVADLDAVTNDPRTGSLRPEFVPNSTTGGPGDRLHPNRAGYQAMGEAVATALTALPSSPRLDLSAKALTTRTAAYVQNYQRDFAFLVADETTTQRVFVDGQPRQQQVTTGEMFLAHLESDHVWASVHDVASVNGEPVADREDLRSLLSSATFRTVGRQLAARNARFNIGVVSRNFNEPLFALAVVGDRRRDGFSFSVERVDRAAVGEPAAVLAFREREQPTLVKGTRGNPVYARGSFTIDAGSGRIRAMRIALTDSPVTAELETTFEPHEALRMWVPSSFTERYTSRVDGRTEETTCVSTYANYRRFEGRGRIKLADLRAEPRVPERLLFGREGRS